MWNESSEQRQPLRTGLTTGTCATACCVAASTALLSGAQLKQVRVELPKKNRKELLSIEDYQIQGDSITALTIKDAGDDPDVTHGAQVFVTLSLQQNKTVTFKAGEGVGTVTRSGLSIAVGEPAINPVPRTMMIEHLQRVAKQFDYRGGFVVCVGVKNGELLAIKTMNSRLGIEGGLSILGTTGIVRPFSCSAWIASVRQGIDVAYSNQLHHIAATTGNYSERAMIKEYNFEPMAIIEMGDFAHVVFKHLHKAPVKQLSVCGGFGKLTKLAYGHLDLHSRSSSIDFDYLSQIVSSIGGDASLLQQVRNANTSIEVLELCQQRGLAIADKICELAYNTARKKLPDSVQLNVWAINRHGDFVGHYIPPQWSDAQ